MDPASHFDLGLAGPLRGILPRKALARLIVAARQAVRLPTTTAAAVEQRLRNQGR
jgi:hypothetical protein